MRLKTIAAPDMQLAMEHIRESMGENAVILSSKSAPDGDGIHVTVAIDEDELPVTSPDDVAESQNGFQPPEPSRSAPHPHAVLMQEIEHILEFHSLPPAAKDALIQTAYHINFERDISPQGIARGMAKLLDAAFRFSPLEPKRPGFTLMLIGPPGIGKTMAIAKLAAELSVEKHPIAVISTDNTRAGGIEQLSAFTSILGIDLQVADTPADLRRCILQSAPGTSILIDTAGSNPYDKEQLAELEAFIQATGEKIEPVLTIPAGLDAAEARHIANTFAPFGVRRLMISRADTARRYGSLLGAAHHAELAFCNISASPRVVEGVPALDARSLADLLTHYKQHPEIL